MNQILKKVNEVLVALVDGVEYEFADKQQMLLVVGKIKIHETEYLTQGVTVDCITIIGDKAYYIAPKKSMIKGEYNGLCHSHGCNNENARYYHHSTREHYCTKCAEEINSDKYNQSYAQRTGHSLCVMVDEKCMPDQFDKFNSETVISDLKQLLHTSKKGLDMLIDSLAKIEVGEIYGSDKNTVPKNVIIEAILIRNKVAEKL